MTNSVIVFEASLAGGASGSRSRFVAFFMSVFVNETIPAPEKEYVPVAEMTLSNHLMEEIPAGSTYSIPLGVTRRASVSLSSGQVGVSPTDKGVIWTSDNENVVAVYPGGLLEARALGEHILITAQSSTAQVSHSFYVNVVLKSAPADFTVSLKDDEIVAGTTTLLTVELTETQKREYDPTLLTYTSSNEHVALINNYGVIKSLNPGTATFSVSGHAETYTLTVLPEDIANPIIFAESITLDLADNGYVYGKTPLNYTFDVVPTDPTVTITSSNEAIAKITYEDGQYFVEGTKVNGEATIRVYANTDKDFLIYDTKTILMHNVLPSSLTLTASNNKTSTGVGNQIHIIPEFSHGLSGSLATLPVTDQRITYTSSDSSIARVSPGNINATVVGISPGTVTISAVSRADDSVTATITLTITPATLINDSNFGDFQGFIRKAVGHFLLFFVDGVFGFWTFYLFLKDKNKRLSLTILFSLGVGLFFAGLSEFIQLLVPGRAGLFLDVVIDFSGYLVATLVLALIIFIEKKRRQAALLLLNKDKD